MKQKVPSQVSVLLFWKIGISSIWMPVFSFRENLLSMTKLSYLEVTPFSLGLVKHTILYTLPQGSVNRLHIHLVCGEPSLWAVQGKCRSLRGLQKIPVKIDQTTVMNCWLSWGFLRLVWPLSLFLVILTMSRAIQLSNVVSQEAFPAGLW